MSLELRAATWPLHPFARPTNGYDNNDSVRNVMAYSTLGPSTGYEDTDIDPVLREQPMARGNTASATGKPCATNCPCEPRFPCIASCVFCAATTAALDPGVQARTAGQLSGIPTAPCPTPFSVPDLFQTFEDKWTEVSEEKMESGWLRRSWQDRYSKAMWVAHGGRRGGGRYIHTSFKKGSRVCGPRGVGHAAPSLV